jgi:hypothetical protein
MSIAKFSLSSLKYIFGPSLRISSSLRTNMDGDQEENWISSHAPRKRVVLSRNNQKWESLREDIRRIYMIENNTLSKAMEMIEEKYRFKAG